MSESSSSSSSASETASTSSPSTFPVDAKRIVDEFVPKSVLHVSFGGHKVNEGSEVTPTIASVLPDICFDGTPDKLYTIIISDPDAPSVAGKYPRLFVNGAVMQISYTVYSFVSFYFFLPREK